MTIYVLRLLGVEDALDVEWNGKKQLVDGYHLLSGLPRWEPGWQQVIDAIRTGMNGRYDLIQMHDAEKIWIEFLRRSYPNEVPRIAKAASWAAAIEYIIAKKHGHPITSSEAGNGMPYPPQRSPSMPSAWKRHSAQRQPRRTSTNRARFPKC